MRKHIDILFDGPPSHQSGRFVEVEDEYGYSISAGEWIQRDGLWALRITPGAFELDPTRYCNACGARRREQCKCLPVAAND
jgi:hypothetical protein